MSIKDPKLVELQDSRIDEFRQLAKPYRREVAGMNLWVMPRVYRGGTDSELLCDSMNIGPGDKVLDVCTGTGVVALKAAKEGAAEVTGTDHNPAAVENAKKNAHELGLNNVSFIEADVFPIEISKFEVITINPPFTDRPALDMTATCFLDAGNVVIRRFFRRLSDYLKGNGAAYVAWSSFGSPTLLKELADQHGYNIKQVGKRDGRSGFSYFVYKINTPDSF